jgi:hypothetical protein
MKLQTFKSKLETLSRLNFKLENGEKIPAHFHITEVGEITRKFIDCGGTLREDSKINFQLYVADDVDHRLSPTKLLGIIRKSERALNLEDLEIEVEYQSGTIGKFSLETDEESFVLQNTFTDCLAKETCGITETITVQNQPEPRCSGSNCC